MHTSQ
jgi:glutathione reductase (NADPH)